MRHVTVRQGHVHRQARLNPSLKEAMTARIEENTIHRDNLLRVYEQAWRNTRPDAELVKVKGVRPD